LTLEPHAVVVRAGALGDVLLLRRTVAGLRRRHPRILLIAPRTSGAALVGPGPSEVDALVDGEGPDIAALFAGEDRPADALRERLRRVGLALVYSRSPDLQRGLERIVPRVIRHDPAPPDGVHAAAWLARPLEGLDLRAPADAPAMQATPEEAAEAAALLGALPASFLAVHPGSGSPTKNWPTDRFSALVEALAPSAPWLLVEGPADADAAATLARRPGAVVARGIGARVLGTVLARAGLFVGHDSGVSHLAAAWGAPTLALFGPTDPDVWAPLGPRVTVVRAPNRRMESLSAETVLAAAALVPGRPS
jgi:heptosyltransferase-2